jgi:hypothetical protein
VAATFSFHFGQPYFYPIAAEVDGVVAGCANGLWHVDTGWLGNIVVLPEFRGRGIGRSLTEKLVDFFHEKGVTHQILVATRLGEPVYRKVGFEVASHYLFFRRDGISDSETVAGVRPFRPEDTGALFTLDGVITGETRQPFLKRYLDEAWVHVSPSGGVDGYYLPKLGDGLIIAESETAGISLLRSKLRQGGQVSVAPEGNKAAVDFLLTNGFVETARAPRMSLGPDIGWKPECVFSRGAGFCG